MHSKQGIIIVNKQQDWTSHDVVARMRGLCGTRRIGHAGTLDPMATGVLPVFFGKATRAAEYAQGHGKEYIATFITGITTDTQDTSGKIISESETGVTASDLLKALPHFTGIIHQTPPMYSAKKIDGKRLYELARKGQTIDIAPVELNIELLELIEFNETNNSFTIKVACSKGTYIRTLGADIGNYLGCGATMSSLCRTRHGMFELSDAHSIDELKSLSESNELDQVVLPVEQLFYDYPRYELEPDKEHLFNNGVRFEIRGLPQGLCRVCTHGEGFIALGCVYIQEDCLFIKTVKNFNDAEQHVK